MRWLPAMNTSGRIFDREQGGRTLKRGDAKGMIEHGPVDPLKRSTPPALDEARLRQQAIGQKLRQMFDEVVNEPIPTDFLDILRRADESDDEKGSGQK
jgi:hypothetical protein